MTRAGVALRTQLSRRVARDLVPHSFATQCQGMHALAETRLASALSIQAHLTALVAYDDRLVAAAKAAGIESIQLSADSSK